MPRLARKYIESSFNHIIIQGINKEFIFENNYLKERYKHILKENLLKTNVKILAYCIMDNHAHILVYSDEIKEVTKLMHDTNTKYAKLYNNVKKRVGYVFRDRYYSQMILTQEQLYNCIVYIHNNPVKANIANKKENYIYSSYREYLGKKDLITNEGIELIFGSDINYLELFNQIHKKDNIENIADIKEEKSSDKIIEEYLKNNNKEIEEIVNDESKFCELLLKLRHYGGLSLRAMSEIFNINKDKLNKIINKKL